MVTHECRDPQGLTQLFQLQNHTSERALVQPWYLLAWLDSQHLPGMMKLQGVKQD